MASNPVRRLVADAAHGFHRGFNERLTLHDELMPASETFPIEPAVPDLGLAFAALRRVPESVRLDYADPGELEGYIADSWGRLLRTAALVLDLDAECLELVANLYFQTLCLGALHMTDAAPTRESLPSELFRNYPAERIVASAP